MKKNTITKITATLVLLGLIIGSISTAILTIVGGETNNTNSSQISQEEIKSLIQKSTMLSGTTLSGNTASGNIQ